ncbi:MULTISPECIES: hypothetical protein [unclassified Janthinobacterium]|uniref:hypothetical protein n=1 Tax=unclassified Janthinobacterium TaxID=2610881 RepID=UPI0017BFFCD7|nr:MULTISPECIES: hypothetical protein [unclassified Janthinobacterium]MBB5371697.1 hypothetical protein [Janthinobacterium sp. K2C7]MBB5384502.1 hypothetical protein [Janthinobacterium sp. K2Li3]MBB5389778.1 hypothetical protein [Janthinobacterium sp. K2E3]
MVQLLGFATELHAPQLGDHQLQVLNLDFGRGQLGAQVCHLAFALGDTLLGRQQQRLQGIDVVGQVG